MFNNEVELERKAIKLAEQGYYQEAREIFFEVLKMKTDILERAEVMANIFLTFDKAGNKNAALMIGREILQYHELNNSSEGRALRKKVELWVLSIEMTRSDRVFPNRNRLFSLVVCISGLFFGIGFFNNMINSLTAFIFPPCWLILLTYLETRSKKLDKIDSGYVLFYLSVYFVLGFVFGFYTVPLLSRKPA